MVDRKAQIATFATIIALAFPSVSSADEFRNRLTSGQNVWVKLDKCNGNIGTLKCGGIYTISYPNPIGSPKCENVIGPVFGGGNNNQGGYCNGNPKLNAISMWGALMFFTADGNVVAIDPEGSKLYAAPAGTMHLTPP